MQLQLRPVLFHFSTFNCRLSVLAPLVHPVGVGECSGVFPRNGLSALFWYNLHTASVYTISILQFWEVV